jgi:hypothetical protein
MRAKAGAETRTHVGARRGAHKEHFGVGARLTIRLGRGGGAALHERLAHLLDETATTVLLAQRLVDPRMRDELGGSEALGGAERAAAGDKGDELGREVLRIVQLRIDFGGAEQIEHRHRLLLPVRRLALEQRDDGVAKGVDVDRLVVAGLGLGDNLGRHVPGRADDRLAALIASKVGEAKVGELGGAATW